VRLDFLDGLLPQPCPRWSATATIGLRFDTTGLRFDTTGPGVASIGFQKCVPGGLLSQPYFSGFTPVGPQVSLCKRPEKLSFLGEQGVPLSKSENI
jgi:hypothetical protein